MKEPVRLTLVALEKSTHQSVKSISISFCEKRGLLRVNIKNPQQLTIMIKTWDHHFRSGRT